MKLRDDILIGIPLFQINVGIVYEKSRRSTAFERVILNMLRRFAHNPLLQGIPLEKIFTDILCVPDPAPLVMPTLYALMDLDIIRCRDVKPLDALTLHDLEITERGQEMIANDMVIPSTLMEDARTFCVDPVSGKIVSETSLKEYRKEKPKISIDDSAFEKFFPEFLIRSHIEKHGGDEEYGNIERLVFRGSTVLWKSVRFGVEVLPKGLKVVSDESAYNTYLSSLDPEKFYTAFIKPFFDCPWIPAGNLPPVDLANQNSGQSVSSISHILAQWPIEARFAVPGTLYGNEYIPYEAPPGQAIVFYDKSHEQEVSVEWNRNLSGCKVFVRAPHPAPESLRLTENANVMCQCLRVQHGGVPRCFAAACRLPAREEDHLPGKMLLELSRRIKASRDFEGQLDFWEKLLGGLTKDAPYPAGMTPELVNIVSLGMEHPRTPGELMKMTKVLRLLDGNWDPEYSPAFFTKDLTRAIIGQFPDYDDELIELRNKLFYRLKTLCKIYRNLKFMTGRDSAGPFSNGTAPFMKHINEWKEAMAALTSLPGGISLEGTRLSAINGEIEGMLRNARQPVTHEEETGNE